jgi:predicted dehydrogenase
MSAGQTGSAGRPLRVGVIGTGVIAQVMHLHYLAELADLFQITAVCDIVAANAGACADRYGIGAAYTDWRDLLAQPLDAVLVLTSGSHAPMAIAAAQAGLHVFVEKPMCFSVAEGRAMVAAADEAGVTLMVGYPKRYDLGYARFGQEAGDLKDARLLRVTTMESPFRPYLAHYPLLPSAPLPDDVANRLWAESDANITAAIGSADDFERRIYQGVLLDTLVHELNTVRGLLGEPESLDYVDLSEQCVSVLLRFGSVRVAIHWLDLPGIARYQMEFALYAPDRRVTLAFPSPYLRNEPCRLIVEGGDPGTARSWRSEEIVGYESAFRRELEAFHTCALTGAVPATSGRDGLADVALCEAIIRCHRLGRPVRNPSDAS